MRNKIEVCHLVFYGVLSDNNTTKAGVGFQHSNLPFSVFNPVGFVANNRIHL